MISVSEFMEFLKSKDTNPFLKPVERKNMLVTAARIEFGSRLGWGAFSGMIEAYLKNAPDPVIHPLAYC